MYLTSESKNCQTQENVWKNSRDFIVTARSSKRKWAVTSGRNMDQYTQIYSDEYLGPGAAIEGNADYVPSFGAPQLFRWKGHWVEITRLKDNQLAPYGSFKSFASLQLTLVLDHVEYAFVLI